MVWVSKREIAYYIILKEEFGDRVFNLGEAMDVLAFIGSRKVVRKVIKNLVKKGLLMRVDYLNYRVEDVGEAFRKMLYEYIRQRIFRTMKSRGCDATIDKETGDIVIMCEEGVRLGLNIPTALKKFGIKVLRCKKELC
ncbi:MAG: hypothetical protein LM572_01505 [Ignisphaera sp.]|jgi:hypothetical protein|nr:hypothetical protein [Ignisphaera sp.]MCC6055603.1 hypothetical protein [Desulfurococcaceae archaeon]